jgi:hypothetical protein
MAGGAILPSSIDYGVSGDLFPYLYSGAGGNAAPSEWGHGVIASLGSDRTMSLRFLMPPSIPSGTLKLRILALANATSGAAKMTVSDGAATPTSNANPSGITLTSETQTTFTWTVADVYLEQKVTLSAAPVANDVLVVAVKFQTTGWTLAAKAAFIFTALWE